MIRRLALLVVASVVISVGLVSTLEASPPLAGAAEWEVHEFNMAANDLAVDTVLFAVGFSSPKPWAVALVEVCSDHLIDDIEPAMASYGFAVQVVNFVITVQSAGACGGASYGNAIFTRGANPDEAYLNLTQDPKDDAPRTRRGICNTTTTFLGHIAACSMHFTKNGGGYAQWQSNEARQQMSFLYPGLLKWGAGDFNLRPPTQSGWCATGVPQAWYDNYWEGDPYQVSTRTQSNQCPPPAGIKNDFIFAAKNSFNGNRQGTVTVVWPASDHHYYEAKFNN